MMPLSKLFSHEYFFRVPDYQRPFQWDEDHFVELIDDLLIAKRSEPYFLGTLVLHSNSTVGIDDASETFDVVDGQQRITSLCILLACARDIGQEQGDNELAGEMHQKIIQPAKRLEGIEKRNRLQVKEQSSLNSITGEIGGSKFPIKNSINDSPSSQRFEIARRIFREKMEPLSPTELDQFAMFLIQQCNVITLITDSFENAFRLFTIVNDRGKQLRRIDVLKAHNLNPEVVPNDEAREKYANQWDDMEVKLGEEEFEELFHLLRLIYVKEKPQNDVFTEFQNRIFGKPDRPERGANFIDTLQSYVNLYDSLFKDKTFLDEGESAHCQFQTLMAAMVRYFGASEWQACILYFAHKYGNERAYDFLLRIERTYIDHWVRGVRKDERYRTYTTILKHIQQTRNPDELLDKIGQVETKAIEDACRSSNLYDSGYAKYLLVRAEISVTELDKPRDFEARSIEHVMPQNPKKDSQWLKWFNDEQHEALVNTAGNLVLLSKSKNSAAGNKEFDEKKSKYLSPKVSSYPRSMQVLKHDIWTPETVEERTNGFVIQVLDDLI
ncbi:DUF262 domain-containing protein [Salininema proteolyticum]|uniref:DUF262 domain-containing protein n=2 Tax=Salininema proteolyticum TaxID=1607685 RepID=A0ABV8TTU7_9ACTN